MIDKLSVSILDIEITSLEQSLVTLQDLGISNLHIDIVDTSFADNISFGPRVINAVLRHSFCFDIHVMVANPCKVLDKLDLVRGTRVTVHSHLDETRDLLEGKGVEVGIALSPDQEVDAVRPMVHKISHVLVMTVSPGFGGQEMIMECAGKIKQAQDLGVPVGVDGGIGPGNIGLVRHADFIVVGSALTKVENKKETLRHILDGLRLQ